MSAYDPSDLLAVCEAILEDGELSGREVYRLSQWLNENRDAAEHWPGNLLVGALQKAWADGKVSKAELQGLGELLLRIDKEWKVRHAGEALEPAPPLPPGLIDTIDLGRPVLPSVPWTTRVRCAADVESCFEVNLTGPTCSCPDWQQNRRALPERHLSRCCRHVLDAYWRTEPPQGWPGWLAAFLGYRFTPHPQKEWMVLKVNGSLVLASTAPAGWADVFAIDDGEYERFGYHVAEKRWAYDSAPPGASYIASRVANATRLLGAGELRVRTVKFKTVQ